jgi:hypothetical protein
MTQEDIIRMAREAGFAINELHCSPPIITFVGQEVVIERFAELVRAEAQADEREACAKLCDAEEETANEETWYQCAKELAKQIRARGNT